MLKKIAMCLLCLCINPITPMAKENQDGQLGSEAVWFAAGEDEFGNAAGYFGQAAKGGRLVLTASNGFFSRGIVAFGTAKKTDAANGRADNSGSTKKGHPRFIDPDYEYLGGWNDPEQTMRWHMWFPAKGSVKIGLNLEPATGNDPATVLVTLGDQTKRIKADDEKVLVFDVASPGKQTLTVSVETDSGKDVGKLYGITVHGPAVEQAKLLRARWRPAAVHGGYRSSKLETTSMWVMVSRSESNCSSYSPITTPFGYYGCSFGADQRSSPGMNFSMWSKTDQPFEQYAHLLAVGSPDAEFSGFGHEGTGVKPRGWEPLHTRPKEVVLALRVERGARFDTYYGYFVDPETGNWKLYCAGRKWSGKINSMKKGKTKSLWPGSFVEVPGPPARQRTGDVTRTVVRKGWAVDASGTWNRLDILLSGGGDRANKTWGVTPDGWFSFKMGGMEHFTTEKSEIPLPAKFAGERLPGFLSSAKVKQLYQLPVTFGTMTARTGRTSAKLNINLKDAGTGAHAIVYYGEKDYLTYAPRKIHGTEKKSSVLTDGNTWSESKQMGEVGKGGNSVKLDHLKPGTTYHYRVLVTNEQGKMWTFETHTFKTL